MKDSTRSILRYTRDILLILIVLVILARTGNMPVLVPDKVTDFIIDTTEDLFSGRVFSSFGGFFSDIGDFFLRGGVDRENRKALARYRNRVEQYLEQSKRNLLYLAAHNDIRRSLPDFRAPMGTLFAKGVLDTMLEDCFDLDQMTVYSGNGQEIVSVSRPGIRPIRTRDAVASLLKQVKDMRGVLVFTSNDGRIVLVTAFASRMRERYGLLLMVLNKKGVRSLIKDAPKKNGYHLYLTDRSGKYFVSSPPVSDFDKEFDAALSGGRLLLTVLREEKFVKQKSGIRRSYLEVIRIENAVGEISIGLLGPEGSIWSFVMLVLRLGLLVAVLGILLYLLRRIGSLTRDILRNRRLSRRLLEISLEKSLEAGNKAGDAARKAVDATRSGMESIERIATTMRDEAVSRSLPAPGAGSATDGEGISPRSKREKPSQIELTLEPESYPDDPTEIP